MTITDDSKPAGSMTALYFAILHNKVVDRVRKDVRTPLATPEQQDRLSDTADDAESHLPDADLHRLNLNALTVRLLSLLPREEQVVFILHHFYKSSLRDIMQRLDITYYQAQKRLRCAQEQLDKMVQDLRDRGLL